MQHPLSDTTQPECRRFRRHVIRGEAKIEPLNEKSPLGQIQDAALLDISRTGVKLQINQSLAPDSTWRLRIIMKGQAVGIGMAVALAWFYRDQGGKIAGIHPGLFGLAANVLIATVGSVCLARTPQG